MSNVYGGDEISAIILDAGSRTTRIGYAGDDFPKVTTPSYFAVSNQEVKKPKRIFGDDITVPRSHYEIKPIIEDSVVVDWDAAIDQYTHYFEKELLIDYKEQPILITEPIWTSVKQRSTVVEKFYENFGFSALYLARAPTCVSFQQGRPNCLVVDIGHDTVSVTPVIDGISLIRNSLRTHYSGRYLSHQITDLLATKFPDLKLENKYKLKSKVFTKYPEPPQYTVRDTIPPNITQSFEDYHRELLYHEMKETLLEVPDKQITDETSESFSGDEHKRWFELPTGQAIELGIERYEIADSLFEPQNYTFTDKSLSAKYGIESGHISIDSNQEDYRPLKRARKVESTSLTPPPSTEAAEVNETRGITQLISHTLSTIDIDLRASVAHNIIITGGVSLIPQLTERLYNELTASNPGLKIRLHAVGNSYERLNQTWIGGSVVASLGMFHQLWVTKEEYEEAGADRILNQRFR